MKTTEQDLVAETYAPTPSHLAKEQYCLDLLLSFCKEALKARRQRAYGWEPPNNTLVHISLGRVDSAARKPGVISPFVGIGFFLMLAFLLLPITVSFQAIWWLLNRAFCLHAWWQDRRQIQRLHLATQAHHTAYGNIYSLWAKFSPVEVGLSTHEGQSLLAIWLSVLYGETSGYWSRKLDHAFERQTRTFVKNHADFESGYTEVKLIGHPTPWSALRAIKYEIPVRYPS